MAASRQTDERAGGAAPAVGPPILEVQDLSTSFFTSHGEFRAADRISFVVHRGEILGVVGESGSGKTVTALSLLRLVDPPGRIVGGSVRLEGEELLSKSEREMQALRGRALAMIWQDPTASLNPVKRIGFQVAEAIRVHGLASAGEGGRRRTSKRTMQARVLDLLRAVNMPDPERRLKEYPHQLSGGLQQRVVIAMALACEPSLLIADEPTTALDVTIQLQILELLERLQRERGMSILLITHDLGVVAETCHRVLVMYAGRIVESAGTMALFDAPSHPYTQSLLQSVPRRDTRRGDLVSIPGRVPELNAIPKGCPFHPRCPSVIRVCREREPPLATVAPGHVSRCHLHG